MLPTNQHGINVLRHRESAANMRLGPRKFNM
jgi:hypothetical protein